MSVAVFFIVEKCTKKFKDSIKFTHS